MSAREMFEKLGYEFFERNDHKKYIRYTNNYHTITFSKEYKTFSLRPEELLEHQLVVNIDLFKAIQKQIKELGWEE